MSYFFFFFFFNMWLMGGREVCTSGPITNEQARLLVLILSRFLTCCVADQIRLASEKFIAVSERFKDQVLMLEVPMRGVGPLLEAVKKLRSSSEHLTALYPDFFQLCLLVKCYKTGLSILEDDIFEVNRPRDFFLYCYYWGVSCCLTFCTSSKMLEEHLHGCQVYSHGGARTLSLGACVDFHVHSFVATPMSSIDAIADNNLGLVKQVVSSMYKRNIQILTRTYLTLSLQDIANTVQLNSPKEAEMHVLQMVVSYAIIPDAKHTTVIQDGEIYATVNQKDGMDNNLGLMKQVVSSMYKRNIQRLTQTYLTDAKHTTVVYFIFV
ncbi:hypothetical protein SADUNF_Sadunf07G0059600 [Salix dunnii]|uniref:COP9 signalosome complex subunit 3 n=1 Tax=Salix dunnii TaxID=1413687 RepID=A0A835K534_9ROSI|nr:hypothetical protein SADUNF_Sadunf07G0059600 [Salix dunnii]